MKKQAINFSWPASLSGFNQDVAHENFSRGKLKVFYKGETADHRFFSDSFSEELVQSLPYTPIVSYYDEEKDDFVGHATEQQIYGMVDPKVEPSFEKSEDGTEWCVCDVVLYTERPDKVGDIAKKIVGHPQSLELDPTSVKYTVNYDDKKHFKNIEFTAGRFVGVSVLGKDQKPAFTGSEFFAYNEEFEKKMQVLRNYCEGKEDQTQHGGEEMDLQEFMKLSWGDISLKVEESLCNEYGEDAFISIVDMFDDSVIARFFYYIEGIQKLMRVHYEISETGDVKFGQINEVHITYEDVIEIDPSQASETDIEQVEQPIEPIVEPVVECPICEPIEEEPHYEEEESIEIKIAVHEENPTDAEQESNEEGEGECACGEPCKENCEENCECGEPKPEEQLECAKVDENPSDERDDDEDDRDDEDDDDIDSFEESSAQEENVEIAPDNKKVSVEDEQHYDKQEDSSSTSFTDSERAEFEALKREKKIIMINSYKENLTEDQIAAFTANVDQYEIKDLELELLKAYKAKEETSSKPLRAFAFAPVQNNAKIDTSLDAFVRKNLR